MIRKMTLTLAAAVGGIVMASQASAAEIAVHYSAQDLASQRGVQALYLRLENAAKDVCPGTDARDLVRAVPARACYDKALSEAVSHFRHPQLSALYAAGAHRRSAG